MMTKGDTLYVGAHADDIFIGAGITISRALEDIHILTVTDSSSSIKYPWTAGGKEFRSAEEYFAQRRGEETAAMQDLGVSPDRVYMDGEFPDQQTYRHVGEIVEKIERTISEKNIERVVTHSFPEAHPDHEIVWFCAHAAGRNKGVGVEEYVTYRLDRDGKYVKSFLDDNEMSGVRETRLTEEEQSFKDEVSKRYETQQKTLGIFRTGHEIVGVRKNFSIPTHEESRYYYGDRAGCPTPEEIRGAMKGFTE